MKKFNLIMMLMAVFTLSMVSCEQQNEPDGGKKPNGKFDVNITEVTKTSMTFSVTPQDLEADYFCFVYDVATADEFTRDQYLVSAIYQEINEEAASKGYTFNEYMPELLDKGHIVDGVFSGLAANTDYYLIIFGVDAANGFKADNEIMKVPFKTATVEMINCTFDVKANVDGNSVEFVVTPSDNDVYWHLISVEKAMYDYYINDPEGYQMTEGGFYLQYFNGEIDQYRQMGYSDEEILALIIPKGEQTLGAQGLVAHTDYIYLVAGLAIDEEGVYVATEFGYGEYKTGDVKRSNLKFDISVTDVTETRAAIKITPSKKDESYCWMIGQWNGKSTAEDIMNDIVGQWGSWLNGGAMLYYGVQDYTGGIGSPYKYKLDAPDTDYYVIAFGYSGGITTDPEMVTFHSEPGPDPKEVEYNMTASNLTPYSANISVKVSSEAVYYSASMVDPAKWDEEALKKEFNANFDMLYAEVKKQDPYATIPQVLSTYYWRGDQQLTASGLLPETTVMGYIVAIDIKTGHIAHVVTFPDLATTEKLGSVTPTVELVGYYSGNDEKGEIFGDAAATEGKAITVVKYGNFEGARTLFTTLIDGADMSNAVGFPDTEVWAATIGFWNTCDMKQPYSFYLSSWNVETTAATYAVDEEGLVGGIGRCPAMATAAEKGKIEDLKALVDKLNAEAEQSSLSMPKSLVVKEYNPMPEVNNAEVEQTVVEEEVASVKAELVPGQLMMLDYVRPYYLRK